MVRLTTPRTSGGHSQEFTFDDRPLPSFDRWGLNIALEIAGAVMLTWAWKTHSLSSSDARERFIRTGRLVGATQGEVGKC